VCSSDLATSATLQSEDEGTDPREEVARFLTKLTGQETPPEAVIREETDPPVMPEGLRLGDPPQLTDVDLEAFAPPDERAWEAPSVLALARKLVGASPDDRRSLVQLWESTPLPYRLMEWLDRPRPLAEVVGRLAAMEERAGVAPEALERELQAALMVGPCLPWDHPLCLRPRVHRFLRGLARFWRCTNPDCGKLLDTDRNTCQACGARALPLALCRTCGWDFLVGFRPEEDTLFGQPITPGTRKSNKRCFFLYDPPARAVEIEAEEDPQATEAVEEEPEEGADTPGPVEDDGDEPSEAEDNAYLCTGCLSLYGSAGERSCGCSDATPLRPVKVHRGRGTRCPICRSQIGRAHV
jgi:hypothetical protein